MVVQGVRPGRFTPRCAQCQEKFALLIPEGDAATPVVKPLPKAAAEVTVATRVNATVAPNVGHGSNDRKTMTDATAEAVDENVKTHARGENPRLPPRRQETVHATAPPHEPVRADPEQTQATRPPSKAIEPDPEPVTLGGHQIIQKLGQGGMGAVYLARQLSLDRMVAVKVLTPELAGDPSFVSRFTREAYAAAQLVHHNIVQVHDIGEDKGRHYYSMEYVPGQSLAALVDRDGKLDPATAVAYTLQAARGLKYAHDRGMIHRDVKPDNLMLSDQGIIKVADLGLVKKSGVADGPTGVGSKLARVQSADVTGFNLSMGTPAYMSPEQARDAAHVDHRADIYSLGCTLYDLLTGRPPFSGKTAMEVMTKHAYEAITPPDVVSKRVPKEVSALLMRMVAKRPEDRYANIDQCILAMEDFLGTSSTGPFTPKEEHAAALEAANKQFRDSPLAIATRYAPLALFGTLLICAVAAAMFGDTLGSRIVWVGTFIGLGVMTVAAYIVLAGLTWGHVVLKKLRPLIFGASISDWVRAVLLLVVGVMVLNLFGLATAWASVALIAAALAAGYLYGLQMLRDKQRVPQLEGVQEMLRGMRMRGLDEDTLRQFVCKYVGTHWEEIYESLFGYDAKLEARRRWSLSLRGKPRPKFAVWRDALIAWADQRVAARKAARERKILARTEEKRFEAEGADLLTARKKARAEAAALVRQSQAMKAAAQQARAMIESAARAAATAVPTPAPAYAPPPTPAYPPPHLNGHAAGNTKPYIADLQPGEREHESDFARRGGLKALLFGTTIRFPLALALLAVFFLWFRQNNPKFPEDFGQNIKQSINTTITDVQRGVDPTLKNLPPAAVQPQARTKDVQLALLPETARRPLSGYRVGLAGLLLLISCFISGWRLGGFALVGTAVMIVGDTVLPGIAGVSASTVASLAGLAVFGLGFAFGRER